MVDLYKYHDPEDYQEVKNFVFHRTAIEDAIKATHDVIDNKIADYLWKVTTGEYKNVAFRDSIECYIISLWTRAKSALLNRKIVRRERRKEPPEKTSPIARGNILDDFESSLDSPDENMHYPEDY